MTKPRPVPILSFLRPSPVSSTLFRPILRGFRRHTRHARPLNRSFPHQRSGHDDLVRRHVRPLGNDGPGSAPPAEPQNNLTQDHHRSDPEAGHRDPAWLGNSREVAEDHYLMVTDEDFERASKGTAGVQKGVKGEVVNFPGRETGQSGAIRCNPERSPQTKTPAHPADREACRCPDTPTGSRTPVFGLRTRRPGPLDDGGICRPLEPT